jgi:hypothetical protein
VFFRTQKMNNLQGEEYPVNGHVTWSIRCREELAPSFSRRDCFQRVTLIPVSATGIRQGGRPPISISWPGDSRRNLF